MPRTSASTVTVSASTRLGAEQLEERINLGTGTFTGPPDNGQFNFAVSVRFNATAGQLANIQDAFQNGSQILADATDGKHKFGEVTIVNNSRASDDAEVWILPGKGRAFATYGKYGIRGEHITMFYESNFLTIKGADGDAYTIAHEFGHHLYGLGDSYLGPHTAAKNPFAKGVVTPPTEGVKAYNAPLALESPTLSYSLMDDYFNRGGKHPSSPVQKYTLNEFSVDSNHDPDRITWQSHINGNRSDWATIQTSRYPATPPNDLPVDAAPPFHTVTFRESRGDHVITSVIDRSGSMTVGRFENAQAGSRFVTHLLAAEDDFGVLSFSDVVTLDSSIRPGTAANMTEARTKIDGLTIGGGTDILTALLAALDEVKAVPPIERSPNEVVLLLTDGDHTGPGDPRTAIPLLQAEGVSVIAIGVGGGLSPAGQHVLQAIGQGTNGYFVQANTDFEVLGWFFGATMGVLGYSNVLNTPVGKIGETEPAKVANRTVRVEAGAQSVAFAAFHENTAGSELLFTLVGPGGQIVHKDTKGVKYIREGGIQTFVIDNPVSGDWKMLSSVAPGREATNVQLRAAIKNPGTALLVSTGPTVAPAYPGPIPVFATPTFQGQRVHGAKVTGTVLRPDGTQVPITLRDDGLASNGDAAANDGVYSAQFSQFSSSGNGAYSFDLRVETSGTGATTGGASGLFAAPHDGVSPETNPLVAVPDLSRGETLSFVVENVPELPGGVVTGRVFDDANGNKLVDLGEAGFGGVTVYPDYNLNGERDTNEPLTFTNGDGSYQLELTNPGNYLIRIQVPEGENLLSDPPTADVRDNLTVTGIDFALGEPVFLPPSGPTANGKRFVVAGGAGNTLSIRDASGSEIGTFAAFDGSSGTGTRVALADFTGDNVPDIVVGTGAGVASRVRILDGVTGKEVFSTAPFEGSFVGGVFVAAGDLNGDGVPELVITPDVGGGPRVLVLNGSGFTPLANFFWIDEDFRGGARAAIADLDGDGIGDLVVAAGVGGGPRVAGLAGASLASAPTRLFPDFFAFDPSVRTGLFVAAGDLSGDGMGEIVAAPDAGGGPRVTAYDVRELLRGNVVPQVDFLAGAAEARGGTRVAVRDLNSDGTADLIVGTGNGNRVTGYSGTQLRQTQPATVFGFDLPLGATAGIFVG